MELRCNIQDNTRNLKTKTLTWDELITKVKIDIFYYIIIYKII